MEEKPTWVPSELAKSAGVSLPVMRKRLKDLPPEAAAALSTLLGERGRQLQAARKLGWSREKLRHTLRRLGADLSVIRRGFGPERAIPGLGPRAPGQVAELARISGARLRTFAMRLYRSKMTEGEAVACGPSLVEAYPAEVRQRAADAGIKWSTMLSRIASGLSVDLALARGPAHRPGRRALAKAAGCSISQIQYRLDKGLSADEAVRLGRRPKTRELASEAGVSLKRMQWVLHELRQSGKVGEIARRHHMEEAALHALIDKHRLAVASQP